SWRVSVLISWKVRHTVESDGTFPNSETSERRYSMSAQLSPPPAITAVCWVSTLPRSWIGRRSPRTGMRDESESPSPKRSAKEQRACSPTWATTPLPPGSTITGRALVVSISEVALLVANLVSRQPQFLLQEGLFRGCASVSSRGLVKEFPNAPSFRPTLVDFRSPWVI